MLLFVYQVVLTAVSVSLPLPFSSSSSLFRRMWSCQTLSLRSSKISWRAFCSETFPRGWAVRAKGTSVCVSGLPVQTHPCTHTHTHAHTSLIKCPQAFQMNPSVGCLLPVPPRYAPQPFHPSTHCGGGALYRGSRHMTPSFPQTSNHD